MSDAAAFLGNTYFFHNLPDDALNAVVAACAEKTIPKGDLIFQEGENGDRLYILLTGSVELWKGYGSEVASQLAIHGPGQVFGEMALVDDLPRSATAVAARDASFLYLQRDQFHGLVESYPQLSISIMKSLSAIVRNSNDSFVMDLHLRNEELQRAYAQLEQAQQDLLMNDRLSNLGKMSNMILHDIRNPVAVLRGYAAMLDQVATEPEKVHDFAGRIRTEADRLSHLSGELLDYTRGEVRLDLSVVKPSDVARQAIHYLEERNRSFQIQLNVVDEDDSPVVLDQQRMIRVLLNLLENARKACRGSGTVTLSIERPDTGVVFIVRDTGEGIPEDLQQKIFEPFFSRSHAGGTGLGLLVVRTIVEAHRGTLRVESCEGCGTRVTVELPGSF